MEIGNRTPAEMIKTLWNLAQAPNVHGATPNDAISNLAAILSAPSSARDAVIGTPESLSDSLLNRIGTSGYSLADYADTPNNYNAAPLSMNAEGIGAAEPYFPSGSNIRNLTEFAVDTATDPTNYVGAGMLGKLKKGASKFDDLVRAASDVSGPGEYIFKHGSPVGELSNISASRSDYGFGGVDVTHLPEVAESYSRGRRGVRDYVLGSSDELPPLGNQYSVLSTLRNPLVIKHGDDLMNRLEDAATARYRQPEELLTKYATEHGHDSVINYPKGEHYIFGESLPVVTRPQLTPLVSALLGYNVMGEQ